MERSIPSRKPTGRSLVRLLVGILALSSFASAIAPARATEESLVVKLDPDATQVRFTLDATGHVVRGSFALEEGEVRFDPESGEASGRLVVDATTADTGNERRDRTMHREVLESGRHPELVFHAERVLGGLEPDGTSTIRVRGMMEIHGSRHRFTIPATVTRQEGRFTATSRFTVPYVAWGLEDPSFLFLQVAEEVEVQVDASGTIRWASIPPSDGSLPR